MKALLYSLACACALPLSAHDQISIPQPLRIQVDESFKREVSPGRFADQWVATFKELRFSSTNRADVVLINADGDYVIENVYKIEQSEQSSLLVLTYRSGRRDYKAIISPAQIRMIRESDPD
ncbi:hypothetical protein [Coraliomargarita akajimensis]|nr:hypothetical protein [Coraliomargarita akajimensis]